ncbi:hypothetical protein [Dactylosporangium sp. NPDC006015]|uniref:hypothetical protein n=1 Tax=Dactylosporangium sp. NPDC006015 TaxID=3154576 RepID=UPI0033A1FADF
MLTDALRVSLVDIVAGWDMPAEQKVAKTICSAVQRGFFRLSNSGSSAIFYVRESGYYSLGEQTIPPAWDRIRNLWCGNPYRRRAIPQGGQNGWRATSGFVNSTASGFADCLDEIVVLDAPVDFTDAEATAQ